jgi:hypothetical protein
MPVNSTAATWFQLSNRTSSLHVINLRYMPFLDNDMVYRAIFRTVVFSDSMFHSTKVCLGAVVVGSRMSMYFLKLMVRTSKCIGDFHFLQTHYVSIGHGSTVKL